MVLCWILIKIMLPQKVKRFVRIHIRTNSFPPVQYLPRAGDGPHGLDGEKEDGDQQENDPSDDVFFLHDAN